MRLIATLFTLFFVATVYAVDSQESIAHGGCLGINWALIVAVSVLASSLVFVSKLYLQSLKDRIKEHAQVTLMLKEAQKVIHENTKTREKVIAYLSKVGD